VGLRINISILFPVEVSIEHYLIVVDEMNTYLNNLLLGINYASYSK